MWTLGTLFAATMIGVSWVTAEMPLPARDAGWREPLGRAEAALLQGETQRAEQAWEEAQRAAMRPTIPPSGLVDVGLAYLKIGEAAHDRQTALTRTRQVLLRALFRARHQRDVEGLTAVSHAFALLGDCEVAAFAAAVAMSPKQTPPMCGHPDVSASPHTGTTTGSRAPAAPR